MNLKRSLENLFKLNSVLLTTRSSSDPTQAVPVTAENPLPVVLAGGTGGAGGGSAAPTQTYGPEEISVTNLAASLHPPAGATHALVTVTVGRVRMAFGNPQSGPEYSTGSSIEISGAQLPALQLFNSTGAESRVWVDYWREA